MPELTPKLGIKKPLGNETVSRAAFNENWDIIDANVVADKGGVPSIQAGPDASKPAAGTAGRLYVATDTQIIYRDTGTAWAKVGVVKWGDIDGKPSSFTPSAHKTTHASGGADALAPADIGAAPSSHTHTRSQVTDFAHKSTHAAGQADALTPADIGAVNKAGDTMTGALIADRDVGSSDTRIYKHLASYKNSAANLTGTLKISLPKSWSNTMLRIRIVGYDYSSNSAWEVTVAGYNYSGVPGWHQVSAELRGMAPFSSIRLGHDGTVNCILLGTTTTTWQYPHVVIEELIVGHQSVTGWESGWQISLITDETGIGYIVTPSLRVFWHAGNDGAGSGLDADLLDGLHVTGSGTPGLRKITVSTANPSGGADGDVWLKYA